MYILYDTNFYIFQKYAKLIYAVKTHGTVSSGHGTDKGTRGCLWGAGAWSPVLAASIGEKRGAAQSTTGALF